MDNINFIATTTSSLEGYKIYNYLGAVTAHRVLGTNIISDFIALFTDVLGGRSKKYEKKLEIIYEDAIEACIKKVKRMKGNCIIGLKIDLDEISGHGKSMFMITVSGTGACAFKEKNYNNSKDLTPKISFEQLEIEKRYNELKEKCINGFVITEIDDWNFISDNQFDDFYNSHLKYIVSMPPQYNNLEFIKNFQNYTSNLTETSQKEKLYTSIINENEEKIINFLIESIRENKLFDFDKIIEILSNPNFEIKKRALTLIDSNSKFYDEEEFYKIDLLIKLILESFPLLTTFLVKNVGIISKNEKTVIKCTCGKTREINQEHCSICLKDQYGFKPKERNPIEAVKILKNRKNYLQNIQKVLSKKSIE